MRKLTLHCLSVKQNTGTSHAKVVSTKSQSITNFRYAVTRLSHVHLEKMIVINGILREMIRYYTTWSCKTLPYSETSNNSVQLLQQIFADFFFSFASKQNMGSSATSLIWYTIHSIKQNRKFLSIVHVTVYILTYQSRATVY